MPQRQHPTNGASQHGDDFQRITGIGPALARRLWNAGILTYHDLADKSPGQIAEVLADVAGISPERIASQDWTGQARQLAGPPPESSDPGQHYASFHLEFLLESDNSIRRTKVHHHQTEADDAWPGWNEDRLTSFLRDRIPLDVAPQAAGAAGRQPPARSPSQPPAAPAGQPPAAVPAVANLPPPATLPPSSLAIEELAPVRAGQTSYVWRHDEPISARLTLRMKPAGGPLEAAFDCTAEVAARKLGGHDRLPIGTAHGTIRVDEPLSFELTGPPAPPGLYRLVATVAIYPAGHSPQDRPIHSGGANGDLLQVAGAPDNDVSAAEPTPSAN
jgi:hypothetical protein